MAFKMDFKKKIEEAKTQKSVCLYCGYDKETALDLQLLHHIDSSKSLHICPFCRRQICSEKKFRKLIFDDEMIEMFKRSIKARDEWSIRD
jgi:hypothetical protein